MYFKHNGMSSNKKEINELIREIDKYKRDICALQKIDGQGKEL